LDNLRLPQFTLQQAADYEIGSQEKTPLAKNCSPHTPTVKRVEPAL
jgi:hypothetical protein